MKAMDTDVNQFRSMEISGKQWESIASNSNKWKCIIMNWHKLESINMNWNRLNHKSLSCHLLYFSLGSSHTYQKGLHKIKKRIADSEALERPITLSTNTGPWRPKLPPEVAVEAIPASSELTTHRGGRISREKNVSHLFSNVTNFLITFHNNEHG